MKYQIKVKAKTINTIHGDGTFYYPMYRKKVRPLFQWLIPFSYYLFLHCGMLKNMRFDSLSDAWEFAVSITPGEWNEKLEKAIKEDLEKELEYKKHLNKIIEV